MKKILFTFITFLSLSVLGQDVVYNFNTGNESFTQGGFPSFAHNANGYLTTADATTFTGGFQTLRTPEGLNLSETDYTIVRIVVENSTDNVDWQIMNYVAGGTDGGTAGRTDFTIASVAAGSGFTTYDIPITAKPSTNGVIDRLAIRAKQGNTFDWSGGGELKVAQMIIINAIVEDSFIANADFETSPQSNNWSTGAPDANLTFVAGNGSGSAAQLTFFQDLTNTSNNMFLSEVYDFGQSISPLQIAGAFEAFSNNTSLEFQVSARTFDANDNTVETLNTGTYTTAAPNVWETFMFDKEITLPFNKIIFRIRIKGAVVQDDIAAIDNITASMSYSQVDNSWTGGVDSDWTNTANWTNGVVPSATDDINIQVSENSVVIGSATSAAVKDLEVNANANLTINAGGSLIVNGTSSGNVTYNRTLTAVAGNANGWHLVASPVAGETFDNTWATANNIATGSSNNLGVATYNTSGNSWIYLQSPAGSIGATSGLGYSMKIDATGTAAFTGTINTADVDGVSISTADDGYNLLGNPFTSYMSSETFLDANANLDQNQIWTWTHASGYTSRTKASDFILAPGQGFFVQATSGTTVDFAESNQSSGTDNFQKTSPKSEISLFISDAEITRAAQIYYFDNNATTSFDVGYEGKLFGGVSHSLAIFSDLVSNTDGNKYQVQSLPKQNMENTIVPLGIIAGAGKEVTFTAEAMNLPDGLKVFLEDRENNTITRLDEANTTYKVQVASGTTEGRFYLHTNSGALSTDTELLNSVSIYKSNATTLRIVGLSEGQTSVKLFNLLGKQVMTSNFNTVGVKELTLPNLSTGVYIVQLETENGKLNKKIVLE